MRRLTQSLAMLEAVIERNWERRYYLFNQHWSDGERLASMRNGEGDEWFCFFSRHGAFLKGLYHESEMARGWPGLLHSVPEVFKHELTQPAFSKYISFCIWRVYDDDHWHTGTISYPPGDDPDGSAWMLAILDGNPRTYQQWAEGYYKRHVSLPAVGHIYAYKPLTERIVRDLNSDTSLSILADDIAGIGYPIE